MTAVFVHVNDDQERALPESLPGRIRDAVQAAAACGRPDGTEVARCEISVTLVGEGGIRELNRRFHQTDAPTDVLAFDLSPSGGGDVLGDVYVCAEVAADAAAEHGETVDAEIVRLAIHGTLHLIGYDHPEGADRYESEMFRLQERVLDEVM